LQAQETPLRGSLIDKGEMPTPLPAPTVLGHLDKSHIAIHTYPEYHHLTGLASFRVDIDIPRAA